MASNKNKKPLVRARGAIFAAAPVLFGGALLGTLLLGTALPARAQSVTTNSASYNAGYGRTAGQENSIVDYSTRDANGNRVIVDGVMLTGADQSVYSSRSSSGSLDSYSGVGSLGGSSGATAIGNNLTVITQGSNNVVIVNSKQVNNGNVSASASTNGGVSNGN
ncbi:holdfast anchoring protein HfaA [Caulobacter hibisci]|uniref:Holdfast anchoring protein HfaA n=1 Tax=Caulobacter hibisci TaxID=2035993 RepID=A0ABS0T5C3_9CAUL|nr:holdfast anchoring protein HfaA [Caulobacter hibisci]MBI1687080.1 holdfast anchoring protein HfaA [Caulobacter hibisci]